MKFKAHLELFYHILTSRYVELARKCRQVSFNKQDLRHNECTTSKKAQWVSHTSQLEKKSLTALNFITGSLPMKHERTGLWKREASLGMVNVCKIIKFSRMIFLSKVIENLTFCAHALMQQAQSVTDLTSRKI